MVHLPAEANRQNPRPMQCPKCQFEQQQTARECGRCGVIFDKFRNERRDNAEDENVDDRVASPAQPTKVLAEGGQPPRRSHQPAHPASPESSGIEASGWRALGVGLVLAVLLNFFPLLSFLLSPLITLVHELGHTVANWVFGYPALPAFDFVYGGGVTMSNLEQEMWIVIPLAGGLGFLVYRLRERLPLAVAVGSVLSTYLLLALSNYHHPLIWIMGHGAELLFAGLFLYRGVTGWGCVHQAERPLYTLVGFYIVFHDIGMGYQLAHDPYERAFYRQGKGGLDHDLVRFARFLEWDLAQVGRWFACLPALTVSLFFAAAWHRGRIASAVSRLLDSDA